MSQAVTGIDAHYYLAKDFERALGFYRSLLGAEPARTFPTGAEFDFADGSTFGISKMPDGSWHPGGGAMFAVDDVADALKAATAHGARALSGVLETGACVVTWCVDTEGNSFSLHHRTA